MSDAAQKWLIETGSRVFARANHWPARVSTQAKDCIRKVLSDPAASDTQPSSSHPQASSCRGSRLEAQMVWVSSPMWLQNKITGGQWDLAVVRCEHGGSFPSFEINRVHDAYNLRSSGHCLATGHRFAKGTGDLPIAAPRVRAIENEHAAL